MLECNQECDGTLYEASDTNSCCLGDCIDEISSSCSEKNGINCNVGELCSQWLEANDTKNCCKFSCTPTQSYSSLLECKEITNISSSYTLTSFQSFSIVPYNYEFGMVTFGMYNKDGWHNYYPIFSEPKKLAILFSDKKIKDNVYDSGTLIINCDGVEKNFYSPKVDDTEYFDVFIINNNIFIDGLIYVGLDGNPYYR